MSEEEYRGASQRAPLDALVGELIPGVLLALGLLYLFLSGVHFLLLDASLRRVMVPLAGGTSVGFLVGWFRLRQRGVPAGFGHPIASLMTLAVLANSLVHLAMGGEAMQATNLILVILGVGLFFLDWGWFAVLASAGFAGWFIVAREYLPDPEWIHFGFALIQATVLAGIVLMFRMRSVLRLTEMRAGERVRQIEIESALDQTERARRGEEEARRALEGAIGRVRESEERFRRLADATFEGVLILQEGKIVDANSRLAELIALTSAQLVGTPVAQLFEGVERERVATFLASVGSDTREGERLEATAVRSDGRRFPAELSVVESQHRERPATVLVLRDITDQKQVEHLLRRALDEAEANSRARSTFLANMSHELRTPLNSVIGFANILQKRLSSTLEPRDGEYLGRILSNGEHLLALIEDILDLSKIDADRMDLLREPLHLDELVHDVASTLELQARKRGIELLTEVPEGLRPVVGDHRRLRQVLLNLVGNALKFTPEGWVRVRVLSDGEAEPAPLAIEVQDTGIGVPQDRREEIFLAFHQADNSSSRSAGGTGLGLTISRSLCERMGFTLSVESIEGEGSTFRVELKPVRDPRTMSLSPAETHPTSG